MDVILEGHGAQLPFSLGQLPREPWPCSERQEQFPKSSDWHLRHQITSSTDMMRTKGILAACQAAPISFQQPCTPRCCHALCSQDQRRTSSQGATCPDMNSMGIHRRGIVLGSVLALAGVALPAPSDAQAAVRARTNLEEIEVDLIARSESNHSG